MLMSDWIYIECRRQNLQRLVFIEKFIGSLLTFWLPQMLMHAHPTTETVPKFVLTLMEASYAHVRLDIY